MLDVKTDSDSEILLNGINRSIFLLTDILSYKTGELKAEQITAISDSIIALLKERERFIDRRIPKVEASNGGDINEMPQMPKSA